ncbi:MAG: CinA family protein [Clostridia bacterium]|nr:CinA family protein [Clostridia bacterium]
MNNAEKTVALLIEQGKRISFAESCTGGLLAATLVDVPDASKVLDMSFVTYANEAKIDLVDVSPETLSAYGAVSEQTAREMASGVARRSGAQIGVSATGIAGPGGGTPEKPVGTVCFGFCLDGETSTCTCHFEGLDRRGVREASTAFVFRTLAVLLQKK